MNELNLKTTLVYTIPSAEDLCFAILQGKNPFEMLTVEFASLTDLALNNISTDRKDCLANDNDHNFLEKAIQKGMTTNIDVAVGKAFINLYQAHKFAGEQLHHVMQEDTSANLETKRAVFNKCVDQLNEFAEQLHDSRNNLKSYFSKAYEAVSENFE